MSEFERGKRAEIGVYDDKWLVGDDISEMITLPQKFTHNNIITKELLDKWNSLGCTSFTLTSEQIRLLLKNQEDDSNG